MRNRFDFRVNRNSSRFVIVHYEIVMVLLVLFTFQICSNWSNSILAFLFSYSQMMAIKTVCFHAICVAIFQPLLLLLSLSLSPFIKMISSDSFNFMHQYHYLCIQYEKIHLVFIICIYSIPLDYHDKNIFFNFFSLTSLFYILI